MTIASTATLGGHVQVGARANLGMGATVHQRRVIGPGVMIGMGAVVTRDVPPFGIAFGNPGEAQGLSGVGMTAPPCPGTPSSRSGPPGRERLPDAAGLPAIAAEAFGCWAAA